MHTIIQKTLPLLGLVFLLGGWGQAQTVSHMTTCGGAVKSYWVTPETGTEYFWWTTGGADSIARDPARTDSISITWTNQPGKDTVFVVALNGYGCTGDTTLLIVERLGTKPTATISGQDTLCYSDKAYLAVSLTGQGPWMLTLRNTTGHAPDSTMLLVAPQDTLAMHLIAPPEYHAYSLVSVTDTTTKCAASVSGSAKFWISPEVKTSPIFHD